MKKTLFSLLVFLSLYKINFAQTHWEKIYPGLPIRNPGNLDITQIDGGFVFCATSNQNHFLLKGDSLGNTVWSRSFDHTGTNEFTAAVAHEGDSVIAFIGSEYNAYEWQAVIGRCDLNGNIINYLPYPVFDGWGTTGMNIQPNGLGGYNFLIYEDGYTSDNHVYLNYSQIVGYDGEDIGLNGMSSNRFGETFMAVNSYFLTTEYHIRSNTGLDFLFQNQTLPDAIVATNDSACMLIASNGTFELRKINTTGVIDWSRTYADSSFLLSAKDIKQRPDGNYYMLCTEGNVAGQTCIFLMETTENGDSLWSRKFYGYGRASAINLRLYDDGDLIIFGESDGDPYVIRTDSAGQINPVYSINGPGHEYCAGDTITLNITPAASSYHWSSGETTQSIQVTQSGGYTAQVTDGTGQLSNTGMYGVDMDPIPVADIASSSSISVCSNDTLRNNSLQHHSLTNLWYKDGVFISGDYYVIVTQSGMYKLIQSNNCGSDTDSVYVNVNSLPAQPFITALPDEYFCSGETVTLVAHGADTTFQWNYSLDLASPVVLLNSSNDSIDVNQGGIYYSRDINSNGCVSVANYINVYDVTASPQVYTVGDLSFCTGDSAELFGGLMGADAHYLWSNGDTTYNTMIKQTGCYHFYGINRWGCSVNSDTVCVTAFPLPDINLGNDTLLCVGNTIQFDAGQGYSYYIWQDGSNGEFFTYTPVPDDTADFWVYVVDTNNCSSSDSVRVISDFCSGVSSVIQSSYVYLYPNPNTGLLHFLSNNNDEFEMLLYDFTGKVILKKKIQHFSQCLDLSTLNSGVYTYQIRKYDGSIQKGKITLTK